MCPSPIEKLPLPSPETFMHWMSLALQLAREASAADEVPVGAVVVRGGEVIGRGREQKIAASDPTAHAEILAIREAASRLGDWRLEDCALFVTLEPCAMCAGAILLARVPLLVFGARNHKFGAVETHARLLDVASWNHRVEWVGGILEADCSQILTNFFSRRRSEAKEP
ncbi:MAG: tRNA-specific adenosine deaminase [Candidatus Sumerlaea sp.]|jgi:tRNA(adenine34) deaminase|nr:tRNA adenosine(34) deaminase TadA [Candidatus Sumerlaea chitinivorans]GIX43724.1 MAG: tRNA-specific adenosine deaminase [Candidatus Sumerlaea sp.]